MEGVDQLSNSFLKPVGDSHEVFRAAMNALAYPAQPRVLPSDLSPCGPMAPGSLALLLTLADHDTPVWLAPSLAASQPLRKFIAFHCGAPVVDDPTLAAFAFFSSPLELAPLARFAQGDPDYPDRSTTLIVQVEAFDDCAWRFSGPGLSSPRSFGVSPAPNGFADMWTANHAGFPLGVDLLFVCGKEIAALPRSLRISEI
jgi:alpha-D-ribose 1-methylphosphonate 5-triphosphate synthase subunit PhnH